MMCYKDKTFCTYYRECKEGVECSRALTEEVQEDADKWWGGENVPVCIFADKPFCFLEKK